MVAIVIDWQIAVLILFAGLLATYIRLKDTPAVILFKDGKVDMNGVAIAVETFGVSIIAAILTAWVLAEQNGDLITSFGGFIAIVASAIGGMSTVRALMNTVKVG
jgi:hypothetical protein